MSADGQKIRAVIFDMDGCLIDSEPLSLEAVAAEMRNSGLHDVTAEEVGAKYLGVSINQIIVDAGERLGHPCPPGFAERVEGRLFKAYETELRRIDGSLALLKSLEKAGIPVAVASGSSMRRIAISLEITGLGRFFEGMGFSADLVKRGKPAPDIFLYAPEKLGIAPAHCAVLEDSPHGIKGAREAGMRAIGFTGGSHLEGRRDTHAAILKEAGAAEVITTLGEAYEALLAG